MEDEERKSYPGRLQAVKLTGAVLLIMIIFSIILGIILEINGIEYSLENTFVYIMTIIVSAVVSLGGVIWYVVKTKELDWEYVRGNNVKSGFSYFKIAILMTGLAIFLSEIDNFLQRIIPRSEAYMETFQNLMDKNIVLVFIALCIVAPLLEETLFRGIILRGLLKNLEHWSAIFFSAFLFGLLHLNIWQGIDAFIIGIFIGWLFFKTGSLQVAVFAHFISNIFIVLAVKYTSIPGFSAVSETGSQPLWFTLTGLVLIIIGVVLLEKKKLI